MTKLLLTIGNEMMGDDGAGALLAQMVKTNGLAGWEVIHSGQTPENVLHQIRSLKPEMVLVVDAADMDLMPGSIRQIQADKLEDPFIFSTHTMPVSYTIQMVSEIVPQVEFLGIQPDIVGFCFPISAPVRSAVENIYHHLKNGKTNWPIL